MKNMLVACLLLLTACGKTTSDKDLVTLVLHARGGKIELSNGSGTLQIDSLNELQSYLGVPPQHTFGTFRSDILKNRWHEIFKSSPPNATLGFWKGNEEQKIPLLIESLVSGQGDNITFKVKALSPNQKNVSDAFGENSLFIDGVDSACLKCTRSMKECPC